MGFSRQKILSLPITLAVIYTSDVILYSNVTSTIKLQIHTGLHTVPVCILCDVTLQMVLAAPDGFYVDINNIKYNFKFNFCTTSFEQSQDVFVVINSN
jgi:hypothetical protein